MVNTSSYFSPNYATARYRFIKAAESVGAVLTQLPLAIKGPDGGELAVDLAWVGSINPHCVILHVCGIHGVEGFAGSAIQLKALEELIGVENDTAIVFVHALNPYGMAWLRRFNGNNVDLNRNCFLRDESWCGAPSAYEDLDDFLNPNKSPSWDLFYLHVLRNISRYGYGALKNVVAAGQYEYPKGLFFGGKKLEPELRLYKDWLESSFSLTNHYFVIDVHTGLGKWGQNSLFHKAQATKADAFPKEIKQYLANEHEESKVVGYKFKGGHWELYRGLFGEAKVDFITQEFGTFSGVRILKGLRAENQYHHYGDADFNHWSKMALKNLFCPSSEKWRTSILHDGVSLLNGVREVAAV